MTKILLASDLHREFLKPNSPAIFHTPKPEQTFLDQTDVVILAGDIDYAPKVEAFAKEYYPGKVVLYVPGNHDYYHSNYEATQQYLDEIKDFNFIPLNPGVYTHTDGTNFIGATHWSDCKLRGFEFDPWRIQNSISDFRLIDTNTGYWSTNKMMDIHHKETEFIQEALEQHKGEKNVVITHFVPSQLCTDPRYNGDPLNPYFINDMDWMMELYKPELWLYGHTHTPGDQVHASGTRLVGHPQGYRVEPQSKHWNHKLIEV